jgi:hypothetical protein
MSPKYSTVHKRFYFPLWPCSQIWQSHLVSDHQATHLTNLIQKTLVPGTERTYPNSQKPNNSPKYESFLNSSHSLNRFSPNLTGSTTGLLNCTVFTLCFGHSKHVQYWQDWSEVLGGRGKRYRVSIIGDDHQPSHRYNTNVVLVSTFEHTRLVLVTRGDFFFFPIPGEVLVLGTFLKLTSWVLVLGPRLIFAWCIAVWTWFWGRYRPGTSQVSYQTTTGIRLVLLQVIPDWFLLLYQYSYQYYIPRLHPIYWYNTGTYFG